MRISDWSSDVCSSDLTHLSRPLWSSPRPSERQRARAGPMAGAGRQAQPWAGSSPRVTAGGGSAGAFTADDVLIQRPSAAAHITKCPTRSEEHTSELQSLMRISYAGFCLKKKTTTETT